jgi:hypothetical protein
MTTPDRSWSVRVLALISLLPFAIIPALLVGWVLYRSHVQTIDNLSDKIVSDVAQRVRMEVESQLGMANTVLNGLLEEQPTPTQLERARRMMKDPAQFESVAHTLVRMNPQTPFVYMGTVRGEFLGVQMLPNNSQGNHRVGVQTASEDRRRYYETKFSGDRSQALPGETQSFNTRLRPWYVKAIQERSRITTPVYVSASSQQLVISMAQPVFDEFNGSLGAFAVDLSLRELNDTIRLVSISRRGVAFIVDNEGMLVASSAGDDLYRYDGATNQRLSPAQSANSVIREAWRSMAATAMKRSDDSVGYARFSGKVDTPEGQDAGGAALVWRSTRPAAHPHCGGARAGLCRGGGGLLAAVPDGVAGGAGAGHCAGHCPGAAPVQGPARAHAGGSSRGTRSGARLAPQHPHARAAAAGPQPARQRPGDCPFAQSLAASQRNPGGSCRAAHGRAGDCA